MAKPNRKRIKTLIRTGDMVMILSGEGRNVTTAASEDEKATRRLAKVEAIDRLRGRVQLSFPGLSRRKDEFGRDAHIRGVEVLKTHRFNPQNEDPGGQRVMKRWIDISNVALVDPSTGLPAKIVRRKEKGRGIVRVAQKTGTIISESKEE